MNQTCWRYLDAIETHEHIFHEAIASFKNNKEFMEMIKMSIFETKTMNKEDLEFCESMGRWYHKDTDSSLFLYDGYDDYFTNIEPKFKEYSHLILEELKYISKNLHKCHATKKGRKQVFNMETELFEWVVVQVKDEEKERENFVKLFEKLDNIVYGISCGTIDDSGEYDILVDLIGNYARKHYGNKEYFGYYG